MPFWTWLSGKAELAEIKARAENGAAELKAQAEYAIAELTQGAELDMARIIAHHHEKIIFMVCLTIITIVGIQTWRSIKLARLSAQQIRTEQNAPQHFPGSSSRSSSAPCFSENGQVRLRRQVVNPADHAGGQARGQAHGEINHDIPQGINNRRDFKYLVLGLTILVTILSLIFDYLCFIYPDSVYLRSTYSFLRSSCKIINLCS